jgi:excinuclease UvrABC nuclease subunit
MAKRKRKTADFNPESIDALSQDKPVVYKVLDRKGENIYTGSAKRGRVAERIKEHLPAGPDAIPGGSKVKIEQKESIQEAQDTEKRIISRSKPKYNKRGQ